MEIEIAVLMTPLSTTIETESFIFVKKKVIPYII
jgi:hypothetical protein